jgi:hypothetical protein
MIFVDKNASRRMNFGTVMASAIACLLFPYCIMMIFDIIPQENFGMQAWTIMWSVVLESALIALMMKNSFDFWEEYYDE